MKYARQHPKPFNYGVFSTIEEAILLNKIGKKSGLNLTNHPFMPKIQFKPLKVVVSLIKSNFYFSKWNLKGFHWKKPWNINFHFIKIGKNLSTIEEFQVKHLSTNLYLYLITNWFLAKPFKYGGSFNYRVFMYGGLTVVGAFSTTNSVLDQWCHWTCFRGWNQRLLKN